MPKQSPQLVRWSAPGLDYEIWSSGRLEQRVGASAADAWRDWLAGQTSFAFRGRHGRLSVVKEARARGTGYWYAYRSLGRRTVKRYLGRASEITPERLEEVAAALAQPGVEPRRPTAAAVQQGGAALLLPKLSTPRLSGTLVDRPRLLELLDAGHDRQLTLVVAPAGFGKTTVVNQWISRRRAREPELLLAWVSLDEGDDDPVRFWRYVISAFQTADPTIGQAALEVLAARLRLPFEAPALHTAVTLLLNDLARRAPGGLLVLDDYHTIARAQVHQSIEFFVEHLPPTLRVVLIARGEPPLPLLRWRAGGVLLELPVAQLRFSRAESDAFLGRVLPGAVGSAALEQLRAQLEGWPAGLRLLALTPGAQATPGAIGGALDVPAGRSRQALLDYFVSEILSAQPETLQLFLLQTSVLGRLSGPLCDAVTGGSDGAARLEAVERAGLFLEALDGAGAWYRYHALFGAALRDEAARRMGDARLRELSLRASRWYEAHALPAEAIETALRGGDPERAAQLLERDDISGHVGEGLTMRRWLEQLPDAVLCRHPAVCLLGAQLFRFVADEAELPSQQGAREQRIAALLEMAERGWRDEGRPELLGMIDSFRALSALADGATVPALEHARKALAVLPRSEATRSVGLARGVALFIVGIASLYSGHPVEAGTSFAEAYSLSLLGSDRHFINGMLLLLGLTSSLTGELSLANEYYRRALPDVRAHNDHEHTINALLGLAGLAYEVNDLAATEQYAREALELARREVPKLYDRVECQLLLLRLARGESAAVRQQLPAILARLQTAGTAQAAELLPYVLLHHAGLQLGAGELEGAERTLQTLLERRPGFDFAQQLATDVLRARMLLANGLAAEARSELERLLSLAGERRLLPNVLELELLLARAYAACGQPQAAEAALRRALVLGSGENFVRAFVQAGEPLARQLRALAPAIAEPALRSFIRTVLRAGVQLGPSGAGGAAPEALTPQEQRVLRLMAAGHTNAEIAAQLVISPNTVKDHAKQVFRKLGVGNRLEAGAAARELRLV